MVKNVTFMMYIEIEAFELTVTLMQPLFTTSLYLIPLIMIH